MAHVALTPEHAVRLRAELLLASYSHTRPPPVYLRPQRASSGNTWSATTEPQEAPETNGKHQEPRAKKTIQAQAGTLLNQN